MNVVLIGGCVGALLIPLLFDALVVSAGFSWRSMTWFALLARGFAVITVLVKETRAYEAFPYLLPGNKYHIRNMISHYHIRKHHVEKVAKQPSFSCIKLDTLLPGHHRDGNDRFIVRRFIVRFLIFLLSYEWIVESRKHVVHLVKVA